MIRVNDREDMQEPVLDMLRSLFSTRNTKDDCIKKLEQCGIELNEGTRKGLDHMCNFSDYVYNTGYEAGVTSGESKGRGTRYSWSNRFIKGRGSRGRRYQSENHEEIFIDI